MVNCQTPAVKCWYCQQHSHDIRVCDLLHKFCKSCFLRGHCEADHDKPLLELWNKFMLASRCGAITARLQAGPLGYHYYKANGLKNEEAITLKSAEKAYLTGFVGDIFDDDSDPPGSGPRDRMRPTTPPLPGHPVIMGTTPTMHAQQRPTLRPRGPTASQPRPGPPPTRRLQAGIDPHAFPTSPIKLPRPDSPIIVGETDGAPRVTKRERDPSVEVLPRKVPREEAQTEEEEIKVVPTTEKKEPIKIPFGEYLASKNAEAKPEVDKDRGRTVEISGDEHAGEEEPMDVAASNKAEENPEADYAALIGDEPEVVEDVNILQQQDQLLALDEDDLEGEIPQRDNDPFGG